MTIFAKPDFAAMKIVEVYLYYDRPLLFACRDVLEHAYLSVLAEEDDEAGAETWLYSPVSNRRLDMVRSGGIDLRTAFGDPEPGFVYAVAPSGKGGTSVSILGKAEIPDGWLPEADQRLDLPTQTLAPAEGFRALHSLREVVSLKLDFGTKRTEAPSHLLGNVLISFQNAMNSLTDNGSAWMRVVGFSEGSFTVEMEAEEQVDLFRRSRTGDAIEQLLALVKAGESDPAALVLRLQQVSPKARKSLSKFVQSMTGSIRTTEIRWESPNPDAGQVLVVTAEQALSIYQQTHEDSDSATTRVFQVSGVLMGLDLVTKHFRIEKLRTGEKQQSYWGYVKKDVIDDPVVQSAQLNQEYLATVEETSTPTSDPAREKLSYKLVKLDRPS